MGEIRIALAGVGNSSCALIQGLHYYRNVKDNKEFIPGLMHNVVGGYKISDIVPVLAFDVDERKVGKDLAEAIFSEPNNAWKFTDVPKVGLKVQMGPVMDGVPDFLKKLVKVSNAKPIEDISKLLKQEKVDALIINLPTASASASRFYANEAIKVGCGLVNGIPELIVNDKEFAEKAKENKAPLVGDDYKSQIGGTIAHRALVSLFLLRGIKITKSNQLNYGGHPDFFNLTHRGESKHASKLRGVTSILPYESDTSVNVSYLSNMLGTKICRIEMWGNNFGDTPVKMEAKLNVQDSANSAGVLVDALRCIKIAKDRGIGGVLTSASACFMKSAPEQFPDEIAMNMLNEFIEGKRER